MGASVVAEDRNREERGGRWTDSQLGRSLAESPLVPLSTDSQRTLGLSRFCRIYVSVLAHVHLSRSRSAASASSGTPCSLGCPVVAAITPCSAHSGFCCVVAVVDSFLLEGPWGGAGEGRGNTRVTAMGKKDRRQKVLLLQTRGTSVRVLRRVGSAGISSISCASHSCGGIP
jgi:hypothetical protein